MKVNISQNLKKIQKTKKLTQEQVSKILNINRVNYNRYENGKRKIPLEILWILADFYQISIDNIVKRID